MPRKPAKTSRWVVDAIEGRFARVELEDGGLVDLPLASIPKDVQEGDVLLMEEQGGDFTLTVDAGETLRRREGAQAWGGQKYSAETGQFFGAVDITDSDNALRHALLRPGRHLS